MPREYCLPRSRSLRAPAEEAGDGLLIGQSFPCAGPIAKGPHHPWFFPGGHSRCFEIGRLRRFIAERAGWSMDIPPPGWGGGGVGAPPRGFGGVCGVGWGGVGKTE